MLNSILNGFYEFFAVTLSKIAWIYILLPCVFVGGIIFTVKNKFIQFTKFGYVMKNTVGKIFKKQSAEKGAVTPFQAVSTALAATLGTGNIIGTSQAIALGGYGAVFWLWVSALLGMIIKYSEVTLSVKYRERNKNGDWVGGPMYYIEKGLGKKWKWLSVLFSLFAALAAFGIGNLSQANSISDSVSKAITTFIPKIENKTSIINLIVGILLAILVGVALLGGIKRIGKVSEILIPFISISYIAFTLLVIITHYKNLGAAFEKIFVGAFSPKAVLGASSGIMMKHALTWGLRRSAFSNEAGLGSAAIAHAAADTSEPVSQGLYGIFEVFVDTILVCPLTALTIIVSNVDINFGTKPGSELITDAFATVLGPEFSAFFVAITLTLFAFSTILGWSLYGTRSVEYLFGTNAAKPYQIIFIIMVVIGATMSLDAVWNMADTFNGLMAIPNFIALFALSGVVAKETKAYFNKKQF